MIRNKKLVILALLLVSITMGLIYCGGGDGGSPSAATYSIGGTVTGLMDTGLVLQNNGADDLDIAADGDFTFATAMADGSGYNVTVLTQPTGSS